MRGAALMCMFALCAALSMHYWLLAKQTSSNEPYDSIVPLTKGYPGQADVVTPTIVNDSHGTFATLQDDGED